MKSSDSLPSLRQRVSHSRKQFLRRSHLHDLCLALALLSALFVTQASIVLGLAVILPGIVLHVWSKATLRRKRELATRGPYALCRHPFYLGNALYDLGLCVLSGNWLLLLMYPLGFHVA